MLESIRKGQRWLTLLLVAFVGAVFVFFMGSGGQTGSGAPTGKTVIQLGDFHLDLGDYQRLRARQEESYREQAGDNYDARALAPFLDAQTLRSLVDGVVLAQSAHNLGLGVSREEIQSLVMQSSSFRDENGKFNLDAFKTFTQYEFGNERNFLLTVERDILSQKMIGLLYDQATVSESEVRDFALYDLETVRFLFVALDRNILPKGEDISDEELQSFRAENEDTLKLRYQENIESFSETDRVHAAHILIQVGPEASEDETAETRGKAETARQRILDGEDFAAVAADVSDDPGSRDQGGDLGIFARGMNVAEIDNAAFSLEAGEISEIVQSAFGFHIVQVSEKLPARVVPFEEVATEMARSDATRRAASDRADRLGDAILAEITGGASLQEAATNQGLTPNYAGPISRRSDGLIPGLGGAPEVMAAAFALQTGAPTAPQAFEASGRRVFIELLERIEPSEEETTKAAGLLRDGLLNAKRNRLVQEWLDEQKSEFERRGELVINSELILGGS
ncbi:MAG: peptidylprolyl isomerase [Myxococcota bacterium]|nr:peptidylprolyl isomerase [Myxococcota bacterium]